MNKFEIKTSLPFPIFKINNLVKYSEVKKPSGIAYMILVLINESKDKTTKLSVLLSNFGVPQNLHYLYCDTIMQLLENKIIDCKEIFFPKSFNDYRIGDFSFTEIGKKVFKEESIPTNKILEDKIPVYYEIAGRKLFINEEKDKEFRPLEDTAFDEGFYKKFVCEKNIEEYLDSQKGQTIKIKPEEVITEVEELGKENWVEKNDCVLTIENDKLNVVFEDMAIQNFYDNNYTAEMFNKALNLKNKFQFKIDCKNELKLSDFNSDDIQKLYIPEDITKLLKSNAKIFITKGNYNIDNAKLKFVANDIIKQYDDKVEFFIVNDRGEIFAYIPAIFVFNSDKLENLKVGFLLKITYEKQKFIELINLIIDSLKNEKVNFSKIVMLCNELDNKSKLLEIIHSYLTNNAESNIVFINENNSLLDRSIIQSDFVEIVKQNYELYLNALTIDNLSTFLKLTNSIVNYLKINDAERISQILSRLGDNNDSLFLYELFVENGIKPEIILNFVNPVPNVLQEGQTNEKSLSNLLQYNITNEKLKQITNISNPMDYVFDSDKINNKEFKENYNMLHSLKNQIKNFKNQNEKLFENYEKFDIIFSKINDDYNAEQEAIKNPKNINKELIERKIVSGDYQFVLVNLAIKLSVILKEQGIEGETLGERMKLAQEKRLFDKELANDLFKFKDCRNAYIHPEDRQAESFTADDLRRWSKEIFNLEEEIK